jgi:hypothetical protein
MSTPLWIAAQAGWPEVVEALIDAGADKDAGKVRLHVRVLWHVHVCMPVLTTHAVYVKILVRTRSSKHWMPMRITHLGCSLPTTNSCG